ncbi:hypothetical protein ACIGGF_01845 [Rhodococcus sp. NPDC078407]
MAKAREVAHDGLGTAGQRGVYADKEVGTSEWHASVTVAIC